MHETGPLAFVFFNRDGKPMMSAATLLTGFVHCLAMAFIIIWWNYPPAWQGWIAFSDAVSWVLLALVLAYFVRPKAQAA